MSVVPVILGDMFGVKHFGRNWGIMMFFNAISASVLQVGNIFHRSYFSVQQIKHSYRCRSLGVKWNANSANPGNLINH